MRKEFARGGGEILSLGDRVIAGHYVRTRTFQRSAHYQLDDDPRQQLFLVCPELGRGPLQLVCSGGQGWQGWETLSLDARLWDEVEIFDSRCPPKGDSWDSGQAYSRAWIAGRRAAKGVGESGVEALIARRLDEGLSVLARGQWREGAGLLRGVGPGLTPSGDDLLAGFLLALVLGGREPEAKELLSYALRGNVLTDTFLKLAAEGRVNEPTRALLLAMGNTSEARRDDLERALLGVVALGATSGEDFLRGLAGI